MNAPLHQPESCSPASLSAERGIILIVDDTPDNLALLSDALDHFRFYSMTSKPALIRETFPVGPLQCNCAKHWFLK